MTEKKQAVQSGEALSTLFLTLNHDRSTLQKILRPINLYNTSV